MLERRTSHRFPAFLGGVIMFSQDRGSAECIIRNRSDGGARLIVHNSSFIPDEFELMIPQRETILRARTRWRGCDDLGIEFFCADGEGAREASAARRIKRLEIENRRLKRRLRDRRA
ncbi:MAG: PilZ domain-containing protein [Xanthobacteraceae bacterium]